MTFYIDTSTLVVESHTDRALGWLGAQQPGSVFISDWVHTEVASALSVKQRTAQLYPGLRAAAAAAWTRLHTSSLPTLAATPDHFHTAADFAGRPHLSLRAGDALHLAIASMGGHALVTLDNRMAEAAPQLGIGVEAI